jgi:hypothetical protein
MKNLLSINRGIVFAIIILSVFGSCTPSRYSFPKSKGNMTAKPDENPRLLYTGNLNEQHLLSFADKSLASRGSMLGQALSLAIMGTSELIALERSKYMASHTRNLGYMYFYDQISKAGPFDPTGMQFNGVEILREVDIKGKKDTAFYFHFEVDKSQIYEIINNSMFNMVLSDFKIKYAKAKLPKTVWYNPVTWGGRSEDERLNMDIEIIFKTSYITREGSMLKDVEIGKFFLPIRQLPLNPNHPEYASSREKLKDRTLEGFSFIIPRSYGYRVGNKMELEETWSQGRFTIEIKIKESGKEKFISRMFYDNSEAIMKEAEKKVLKFLP